MVELCKRMHIAATSRTVYEGKQKLFITFCHTCGFDPYTLSEDELCMAVAHFSLGHSVTTVGQYLSAIQNMWTSAGAGPLPRGDRFHRFNKGLHRLLDASDAVVHTRPISIDDLKHLIKSLDATSAPDCSFACQLITAFFLALRTEAHSSGHMIWKDISVEADGSIEFLLRPDKNHNEFRRVAIAARTDCLDLLPWLRLLTASLPPKFQAPSCSVFITISVTTKSAVVHNISESQFVRRFKGIVKSVLNLDPTMFSGYSLRRGGVTAMLSADKPVPVVKRHVGWAPGSDAIDKYYDDRGYEQQRLATSGI